MQKDNSTFKQKVMLRQMMLKRVENPVIMETHGGTGQLFKKCYGHIRNGVVFEKHPEKAAILGQQRPTWAVYEADCTQTIGAGAGAHLACNVLDVDPYGDPWPTIEAFFQSERPRPVDMCIVVHDGARQDVKRGMHRQRAPDSVRELMIGWYGAGLYGYYLDACERAMCVKAAIIGYDLARFAGFYSSRDQCHTHYLAILTSDGQEPS